MAVGDADTNLTAMRLKFRRVAKTPSSNQITDDEIDDYINWFYQYSLPEELRMFDLKTTYSFHTERNKDRYDFPKNQYVSVEPPSYIAGFQTFYGQSPEEFYHIYPKNQDIETLGAGDGTAVYSFTTTNFPMIRGCVTVTATSATATLITLRDDPANIDNDTGTLYVANDDGTLGTAVGSVVYSTGTISFDLTPVGITLPTTASIVYEGVYYQPSRPTAILFFDNQFTLRPVPDKAYKVELIAFVNPTQLINTNDEPEIRQWWEMLVLGGALKFFVDTRQGEAYQFYKPIYEEQELLAQRKTLKLLQSQRSKTIYTDQAQLPQNNYWSNY